jgi:hypothetical protein
MADGPYAGHWASFPDDWSHLLEHVLLSNETRAVVRSAIAALRPAYRTVITLRDLEGWTAQEVSDLLGVTDANQRCCCTAPGRRSARPRRITCTARSADDGLPAWRRAATGTGPSGRVWSTGVTSGFGRPGVDRSAVVSRPAT